MSQPEFEKYYWAGLERVRCPSPCHFDYETEAEVQACFDKCPRHPKPQKRVSEIVGPKGEDVIVIEEPEQPAIIAPKRLKKQDADATGEP